MAACSRHKKSNGLYTIEPNMMSTACDWMLVAREINDILPRRALNIPVTEDSDR